MRNDHTYFAQQYIRIEKPIPLWVVIPASQVIQPRLFIVYIPTIPEGLDRTQRTGKRASLADRLAPSIVSIRYHFGAVTVNQTNDVSLQVVVELQYILDSRKKG